MRIGMLSLALNGGTWTASVTDESETTMSGYGATRLQALMTLVAMISDQEHIDRIVAWNAYAAGYDAGSDGKGRLLAWETFQDKERV